MGKEMFSYTTYEDQYESEPHFLDACFLCGKSLGSNSDIFMYRGNTPFCSKDCRQEQIDFDNAQERKARAASSSSSSSSSNSTTRSAMIKSDINKDPTPNETVRTGTVSVA